MTRRLYARYRYVRTETHVFSDGAAWNLKALIDEGETEADVLRRLLPSGRLFTRAEVRAACDALRPYGKPRVIVVTRR